MRSMCLIVVGIVSYESLGQVPPRLPVIFFQLTLEPRKVYNHQLRLVLYSTRL